jgi:uncharacterized membrane protein
MMSQNGQEAKDRARSEHDYKVNLKAELEIRHLHEKMDFLAETTGPTALCPTRASDRINGRTGAP